MNNKEFVDYVVHDLMAEIPGVTARAMFGGYGLYKNGVIFAIIIDGELYMKVDDALQKKYEAAGSRPFTYDRDGKPCSMRYWILPADVMADRELLAQWVSWSCGLPKTIKSLKKRV